MTVRTTLKVSIRLTRAELEDAKKAVGYLTDQPGTERLLRRHLRGVLMEHLHSTLADLLKDAAEEAATAPEESP